MISWLQITSGRGPEECCWVAHELSQCIVHEAKEKGIKARIIGTNAGEMPNTFKSVLIALESEDLTGFLKSFEGTVQWIGKSMFRHNHKRKNWFVGVSAFLPPEVPDWSINDVRVEKMRASGPGGQHVNKTETAVRVTHIPTGLTSIAQEERSQYLNRKLAMSRLSASLRRKENEALSDCRNSRWNHHNVLQRGNPVRVYEGEDFRLKRSIGGQRAF
jgi:peptide chain release factor